MSSAKRPIIVVSLVAAATLIAVIIRVATSGGAEGPSSHRDPGRSVTSGSSPEGAPVVARSLGKLESASEEIGVASDLTGRIEAILVDEGDEVTVGQPLVRLDDTLQLARVAAAEAAVRAAEARKARLEAGARREDIRRARALLDEAEARARIARERSDRGEKLEAEGVSPTDETDWLRREAEATEARVRAARENLTIAENETRPEELAAAEAELDRTRRELEAARAELQKTVLRSPITGTVVRRNLRMGEAVSSFQVDPVVTVADLEDLRIRAEVDEIDIGKVEVGQRVYAESESFPDLILHGRVIRLGSTMGRKTIRSTDPNARKDVRIREVLIDVKETAELPLGLRLIVSFLAESASPEPPSP